VRTSDGLALADAESIKSPIWKKAEEKRGGEFRVRNIRINIEIEMNTYSKDLSERRVYGRLCLVFQLARDLVESADIPTTA
jgi:hypothetical protein